LAARAILVALAPAVPLVLLGCTVGVPEEAPSVGREAVLANVFFSDGTSRTVLYTAAEPPVWETAAQTTAPWIAFLPLVAVMVLIAARLAPNLRRPSDVTAANGRITVIRGLRRRTRSTEPTDRAA